MKYPTTVSLTARVDMKDNKLLPGVRLQMEGDNDAHRFTKDKEQHRLTVTADLEAGEHDVVLEFIDRSKLQGGIQIISMHVQGAPLGMDIFQCEYTQWETGETQKSHLYMGRPGAWKIKVTAPKGGVGFV